MVSEVEFELTAIVIDDISRMRVPAKPQFVDQSSYLLLGPVDYLTGSNNTPYGYLNTEILPFRTRY